LMNKFFEKKKDFNFFLKKAGREPKG